MVNKNKQFVAILGRQPVISLAELEALFGPDRVRRVGEQIAVIESEGVDLSRLGGTMKIGEIIDCSPLDYLLSKDHSGKIVLGFSDYSLGSTKKSVMREALRIKNLLKKQGKSVRIVPNVEAALSTATSHHNQLGEKRNRVEFIIYGKIIAVSLGAQNITKYAKRDQARPARDAANGMLPPKLAQILINLCGHLPDGSTILDPFCGTGTVLQEALLMGYKAYGTDLNPKMIEFSKRNLDWLFKGEANDRRVRVEAGDATKHKWGASLGAVACETYLGPPMSAPPVAIKLKTVEQECGTVVLGFLKNIAPQISSGTPLSLAVPAWRRPDGSFSRLKILDEAQKLGYNVQKFKNITQADLLYYRENQIVARELIVLKRK